MNRCLRKLLFASALLGFAFVPQSSIAESIAGLESSNPAPDLGDKLNLFGQFVGDWRFDYVGYNKDGTNFKAKGEWHFGWILEGRAVQDVWIIPARPERNNPGAPKGEYGTTVRFYDPKLDAWHVVWAGPVHGQMVTFLARKLGDEILMEGKDPDGTPTKWIFSQMTPRSFFWRSVTSEDGGKTWPRREEMTVKRAN